VETVNEALHLLRRQAEIQQTLRHSNTNRVLAERDLYLIRRQLAHYPATLQAIAVAAAELHRPVEFLRASDVEQRC
jgi:hypothetical protein